VPSWQYSPDNATLIITENFTPPSPLGTFTGVHWYAEVPDQSVDAGLAADGSTAWDGSKSAVGNPAADDLGTIPYTAGKTTVSLRIDAALITHTMTIRLRAASCSDAIENDYASSPSVMLTVNPPVTKKPAAATAYSPIATGLTITDGPSYSLVNNVWVWDIAFAWTDPTADPAFAQVQGYEIQYEYDDGTIGHAGVIQDPQAATASYEYSVGATETITCWLVTIGTDEHGNPKENPRIQNITPCVTITVGRPQGDAGMEAAPLISNFSAAMLDIPASDPANNSADGVEQYAFTGSWLAPADGTDPDMVAIWVYWSSTPPPDGLAVSSATFYEIATYKATTGTFRTSAWNIGTGTAHLVALSKSRDGSINTYRHGVTPEVVVNVAPGAGTLNPTRFDPSKYDNSEFHVVDGVWQINGLNLAKSFNFDNQEFHVSSDGKFTVLGVDLTKAFNASDEFHIDGSGKWAMSKVDFAKGFHGFTVDGSAIPQITIAPGGTPLGWIGSDSVSGYSGAWFKRVTIGGASPAGAQFFADASGNVVASTLYITSADGTAGWIGSSGGYTGAWFPRVLIGGSNPASAPFFADAYGNVVASTVLVTDSGGTSGWIGSRNGYSGAWFKRVMIGGTSEATAQIVADSTGHVSIASSVSISGASLSGVIQAGGSAPLVTYFTVLDGGNAQVVWAGRWAGQYGLWAREMWIGGTYPGDSKISASAGAVTINGATFTLTANGIQATINNAYDTATSKYLGLVVQTDPALGILYKTKIGPGAFFLASPDNYNVINIQAGPIGNGYYYGSLGVYRSDGLHYVTLDGFNGRVTIDGNAGQSVSGLTLATPGGGTIHLSFVGGILAAVY
jgi:hypothetical protein